MTVHSKFGGSSSSRWINCSGSTNLINRLVPNADNSSSYAEEGTRAHEFASIGLETRQKNAADIKEIEPAMIEHVQVYLDEIYRLLNRYEDAILLIEQEFRLNISLEDCFGRNDATIYIPSKHKLYVYDFKYGANVAVPVEENTQLLYYALGAIQTNPDWTIDSVELCIVQPRHWSVARTGKVKRWRTTLDRVLAFEKTITQSIENSRSDSTLTVGSWCMFCPAKKLCPKKQIKKISVKISVDKSYRKRMDRRIP